MLVKLSPCRGTPMGGQLAYIVVGAWTAHVRLQQCDVFLEKKHVFVFVSTLFVQSASIDNGSIRYWWRIKRWVSVILSNHHGSISAVWSTDGRTEQSAPSTPLVQPVVQTKQSDSNPFSAQCQKIVFGTVIVCSATGFTCHKTVRYDRRSSVVLQLQSPIWTSVIIRR
jgi:hypothetical protein